MKEVSRGIENCHDYNTNRSPDSQFNDKVDLDEIKNLNIGV